jgi:hypothetical protein
VINSLSLVLVIVAAVTLGLGWFQDGLALVYVSIATCLVALALIGVGHLLRRRDASGPAPAGYAAAPTGSATSASRADADARPGRSGTAVATRSHRSVGSEERPARPTSGRRGVVRRESPSDPVAAAGSVTAAGAAGTTPAPAVPEREAPGEQVTPPARSAAELQQVRGLGPAKQAALLERFGSVEAIAAASPAELSRTPGIGTGLARAIRDQLA